MFLLLVVPATTGDEVGAGPPRRVPRGDGADARLAGPSRRREAFPDSSPGFGAPLADGFRLPCESRGIAPGDFVRRAGRRLLVDGPGGASDPSDLRFVSFNVPHIARVSVDCAGDFPTNATGVETRVSCARLIAADAWLEYWGESASEVGDVWNGTRGGAALVPTRAEMADALCAAQHAGGAVVRAFALSFGDSLDVDAVDASDAAEDGGSSSDGAPRYAWRRTGRPNSRLNAAHGAAYHVTFDPGLVERDPLKRPESGIVLNEPWFAALDELLHLARRAGVRVLLPVIHSEYSRMWGGVPYLSRWAELAKMVQTSGAHRYDEREARWGISFYTSAHAKALYKETVRRIVTRVNSVDGVAYKDDPAIFGWELGAELYDTSAYLDPDILAKAAEGDFDWLAKWRRGNPPPSAWTREMATAIKTLDPNHLVVDGANTVEGSRRAKNHRGSSSTEDSDDAPVTSVGTSAARRKRDVERVPFEPIEPAGGVEDEAYEDDEYREDDDDWDEDSEDDDWPVDVYGASYYGDESMKHLLRDMAAGATRLRRPTMMKEFGLTRAGAGDSVEWAAKMLRLAYGAETVGALASDPAKESIGCVGAMYWSVATRARTGGFYVHVESVDDRPNHHPGEFKSLRYPGFEKGDARHPSRELEVMALLRNEAREWSKRKDDRRSDDEPAEETTAAGALDDARARLSPPELRLPAFANASAAAEDPASSFFSPFPADAPEPAAIVHLAGPHSARLRVPRRTSAPASFPPCLPFAGVPGARSYQLWVSAGRSARRTLAEDDAFALLPRLASALEASPRASRDGDHSGTVFIGEAEGGGHGGSFPDTGGRWHLLNADVEETSAAMLATATAHGEFARWLLEDVLGVRQGETVHYCLRACERSLSGREASAVTSCLDPRASVTSPVAAALRCSRCSEPVALAFDREGREAAETRERRRLGLAVWGDFFAANAARPFLRRVSQTEVTAARSALAQWYDATMRSIVREAEASAGILKERAGSSAGSSAGPRVQKDATSFPDWSEPIGRVGDDDPADDSVLFAGPGVQADLETATCGAAGRTSRSVPTRHSVAAAVFLRRTDALFDARFDRDERSVRPCLGAGDGLAWAPATAAIALASLALVAGLARSAHRVGVRAEARLAGSTGGRGRAEGEGEVDEGDDSSFERDDSSFEQKTPFGRRVWGIGGGSDGRGVMEAFAAGMVFFGESVAESVARAAEEAARGFRGGTFFSSSAAAAVNPWADGVNEWSGTGFNLLFLLWGYGIASERIARLKAGKPPVEGATLAFRHAARLLPVLWATCVASAALEGTFSRGDGSLLKPRGASSKTTPLFDGTSFFVLLGLDAVYPRSMDANALNAAAWTVGVFVLATAAAAPATTHLFAAEDGGTGTCRGETTAKRARRLLVVCWIGTALPALELMGWLPWGLANPLAMAAARARLPVALAGVAVAAVAESRRGRGHAHEHAHEHAHSRGPPTLRWFAGRFGGTVSFLAVGLLVALGPRSLAFPGAVDAFAARWFVHGGLLPALAAGVYFVVGNERDAMFSSRPARWFGASVAPVALPSLLWRAFGSRLAFALFGTAAPPLSAELFAVVFGVASAAATASASRRLARLGDGVRRAFQAAPDPPWRGAPTSVAGAVVLWYLGFLVIVGVSLRRGEAATWQSFLLSGGRGRSDASGGSDTYSFDDKRSFAAWGPVLSGSESSGSGSSSSDLWAALAAAARWTFARAAYLFLVPLPALAVNTLGHLLFPAAHATPEPTDDELERLADEAQFAFAKMRDARRRARGGESSSTRVASRPRGSDEEADEAARERSPFDPPSASDPWDVRLHFRIVTRGLYPELVALGCVDAFETLSAAGLPSRVGWRVEVVTDRATRVARATGLPVREMVVPADYRPKNGCKFKARALHYASRMHVSDARRDDWIVHLDEETKTTRAAVRHVAAHAMRELAAAYRRAVAKAEQRGGLFFRRSESHPSRDDGSASRVLSDPENGDDEDSDLSSACDSYGAVGQGAILYNANLRAAENWVTALADAVRVADDYGKFAFQYRLFRQPLIGMHGSYCAVHNAIERDVGFDHGIAGSITEDTYFALLVADRGVSFRWTHGCMHEQSPFSVSDFAKQRARWFHGLWLCVRAPGLRLWRRVVLGAFVVSWGFAPLLAVFMWLNLAVDAFDQMDAESGASTAATAVKAAHGVVLWGYVLGFALNFSARSFRHGAIEYAATMCAMVVGIPVFGAMEAWGVALALAEVAGTKTNVGEAGKQSGFFVVQKEGAAVHRDAEALAGGSERGRDAELEPQFGDVPFRDDAFATGEDALLAPGRDARVEFWRRALAECDANLFQRDDPNALEKPPDRARPRRLVASVTPGATAAVSAVADRLGVEPSDVALALFVRLAVAADAGSRRNERRVLVDAAAKGGSGRLDFREPTSAAVLHVDVASDASGAPVETSRRLVAVPVRAPGSPSLAAFVSRVVDACLAAHANAVPLQTIFRAARMARDPRLSANDGSDAFADAEAARRADAEDARAPAPLAVVVRRAVLGDVEGSEDGRADDPSGPEWIDADAGTPAPAALELRAFLADPTDVSRARLPLAFALAARRGVADDATLRAWTSAFEAAAFEAARDAAAPAPEFERVARGAAGAAAAPRGSSGAERDRGGDFSDARASSFGVSNLVAAFEKVRDDDASRDAAAFETTGGRESERFDRSRRRALSVALGACLVGVVADRAWGCDDGAELCRAALAFDRGAASSASRVLERVARSLGGAPATVGVAVFASLRSGSRAWRSSPRPPELSAKTHGLALFALVFAGIVLDPAFEWFSRVWIPDADATPRAPRAFRAFRAPHAAAVEESPRRWLLLWLLLNDAAHCAWSATRASSATRAFAALCAYFAATSPRLVILDEGWDGFDLGEAPGTPEVLRPIARRVIVPVLRFATNETSLARKSFLLYHAVFVLAASRFGARCFRSADRWASRATIGFGAFASDPSKGGALALVAVSVATASARWLDVVSFGRGARAEESRDAASAQTDLPALVAETAAALLVAFGTRCCAALMVREAEEHENGSAREKAGSFRVRRVVALVTALLERVGAGWVGAYVAHRYLFSNRAWGRWALPRIYAASDALAASSASLGPPVAFAFRIVLVVLVPTLVTAAVAGPATRGLERAFDAVAEAAAGAAGRAAGVVGWRADAAGERRPSRLERQRREWEKKLALGSGEREATEDLLGRRAGGGYGTL